MRFTRDEVERFATWSGDRNPLHVDVDFARHTHFGQPIVHGILTVLGSLQGAMGAVPGKPIRGLELEFRRAVVVDGDYSLDRSDTSDGFAVTLHSNGDMVLTIQAQTSAPGEQQGDVDLSWARAIATGRTQFTTAMRDTPASRSIAELQHGVEITGEYPAAPSIEPWTRTSAIPPVQARVLALCSYITGMELPGLRSLFTRVSIEFHRPDAADVPLWYRACTRRCDAQFRLLETELQVAAPDGTLVATATLRSYVPFSPSATDLDELARRLTPSATRLQGKVALIIGGTRGLGADIVSSLALAGCHVFATSRHQDSTTAQLQQSIAERGGRIELLRGDAGDPDWCRSTLAALQARLGRLDLLVLNACAPPSHTRLGDSASPQEHAYLLENLPLIESPLGAFIEVLHASGGAVVYLSSSFVTHSPAGFGRYVALKQAGEAMTRTAVHEYPGLSSLIVRPPPLQTRWNDTPAGVAGAIPADWVASHIVNRLADTWQAGQVEILSEFPPFADRETAGRAAQPNAAFTVRIAASFTTDPLLPGLRFWLDELDLDAGVQLAPYGQILQSLLDPQSLFASKGKGCNVILLRLRDWLRELPAEQASALDFVRTYVREAASEFEQAIRSHRGRAASDTLLVLCPSYGGASSAEHIVLRQTEAELAAALGNVPGLTIVMASDYHTAFAVNEDEVGDALRDEIAHIPYRDAYLHVLATMVARYVYRRIAPLRKVAVVDCDNTLWRGVVGEVGAEGLEFDEGHRALHETLITLSSSGVLVCLCSKNEEADVWRVFDTRADLALRREHVTAAMINWLPKSQNLRTLAARLNLGIDSFIFIDDNPVECAEVRASCPEVLTIQWPQQSERAIALLRQAWELEATAGTKEDQRRTQMYRDELQRQTLRTGALTFEAFLESLQLVVEFAALTDESVRRAAQLTLRTNQFNFTTKRRDESELQALVAGDRHEIRTVRVRDRFGDYGLVGLVIVERGDDTWNLDTFLLSCRVLGRGVEHQIVSDVGRMAVAAGARSIRLRIDSTARNTPARMFLESVIAPELRTADATGIESVIPADLLAATKFEPTAEAEIAEADEGDSASVATQQTIDFGSVRRREEQLARASSALSTMTGLQAAVEGRGDAVVMSAPASSEIPDVVYRAFATALRMPAETIKSVDRLEALGCDSLRIVEITVALREQFPWLPSTLLFEHRSVTEILAEIHVLAGAKSGAGVDTRRSSSTTAPRKSSASTDIAVVGMDVMCAGAQSLGELWNLLKSGRSGVQRVTLDRKYFLGRLNDTRPHWAGLLDNPARFDAEFFGVSPREAEYMDPQLRLFLEVAWSAIEDAGYTGVDHNPDTGVFVGVMYGDYGLRANRNETESPYRCWEGFSLANRLSQLLDFHGPSLAVDTACSSSGTALHLACRALTAGDCRVAIVGGVNLILDPDRFASLGRLGILSANGSCEPFGAGADGTVLGEGAGVVVLRPLDEAQRHGDRIYGVIKGTGLSTGNGTVGFTAPNPQAQADAIRRSIEAAGVDPRTVTYVETHGTGTALGDPIEVRGLTLGYGSPALQDPTLQIDHRCTLGSIKPNVGHLEAGAGVVGLIKVLLQLHHRTLVPSITSEAPNPQIPFQQTPFAVQRTAEPWKALTIVSGGRRVTVPRRAGLSSFGVGGANAHVIVEEAPSNDAPPRSTSDRTADLVTLSARTDESLRRRILHLRQHVEATPELAVADLAYSLNTGHQHFDRRVAIIGRSRDELIARLEAAGADGDSRGVARGALSLSTAPPKVGFLFTGQGSQYAGMGRQLYDTQPVFRDALDRCATIFDSLLSRHLLELLFAEKDTADAQLLNQTGFTQPALFAFEYALATLWQSWGIHPAVVLGHSVGEIGAICVAGGVSLEDGLKLIAARGHLMQALPPGGMMTSVMADEGLVLEAIAGSDEVAIAAVNAPRQVVISGAGTAVAEVTARLTADGIKTKALTVSHAFHSPLMKPMLAEYERVVRTIRFTPPRIPFVSCVDGALVSREVTQPEYWLRQVMDPVRFAAGMRVLDAQGVTAYLEIGPQPVLLGMGRQCLDSSSTNLEWLPSLKADTDSWQTLLGSLSTLYVKGAPVDWKGFDSPYHRRRVEVPAYAFREKEYWLRGLDSTSDSRHAARAAESMPPLREESGPQLYELQWRQLPPLADDAQAGSAAWVIFADSQGMGEQLASLLVETGVVPTVVTGSARYAQIAAHRYEIDGSNAEHYARLWSALGSQLRTDVRVVHLWGLDAASPDRTEAPSPDRTPPLETLLHLSRAVAASGLTTPKLWCVTRGAVAIGEESALVSIAVEQAPLWGFGRTMALEHPELWGGLIDLAHDDVGTDLRPLINQIVATGPEDQIALRGPRRYAPRLEHRENRTRSPVTLRADATYLVTGGVGALGLHVAQWLIMRGARHLVLASRRGGADPQARPAMQALEALGATVTVVPADVSRAEGVDALMAAIADLGHQLRGVVHAAGIDVPTPVGELSVDALRAVMSPKATGGWLLHERTRELPLDFFVLFSSVASVLGSNGRAHYGAANAFLDALALKRRQIGLPGLAINWGPWRGGGMASDEQLREFERIGNRGLEPDDAMSAMEGVLGGTYTQCSIVDVDWDRFRPIYEARRQHPLVSDLGTTSKAAAEVRATAQSAHGKDSRPAVVPGSSPEWVARLLAIDVPERQSTVELALRQEVAELLGFDSLDDVPPESNFYQLGMDSLMTAELVGQLRKRVGISCTGLVLDYPNVRALAPRLLEALHEALVAPGTKPAAPETTVVPSALHADVVDRVPDAARNGFSSYTPDDDSRVFALQTKVFPDRNPEWILPRWRWMFVDSAKRLGRAPQLWLYHDADRIVGQMGGIPVRLKIGSGHRDTAWMVETMVLESHRSQAIGSRMMLQSHEDVPFSLSLGQSPEMREIQDRLGWKQVAPLRIAQLLIRPENVLKRKLGTPGAWAAGLGLRASAALRDVFRDRSTMNAREIHRFDDRHDALWAVMARDVTCAVVRDASFLNWKYVDQPGQQFIRLELAEGGNVQGVVVLSLREPDAVYAYRRAFLVDIVGSLRDENLLLRLIQLATSTAAERGADSLVCMHLHASLTRVLKASGFRLRKPVRFLLIDTEGLSEQELALVIAPDNWLLTQGDSDIDRPGAD